MNTVLLLKKLSDPNILAGVNYIGVLLTIYFGVKVQHKRIYYKYLIRKDSFIIVFWNAGNVPILREDIWILNCIIDKYSDLFLDYSTDSDVPLEIEYEPVAKGNQYSSKDERRVNFTFGFMNKREGYYAIFKSVQKEPCPNFYGRLRGESRGCFQLQTSILDEVIIFLAPASIGFMLVFSTFVLSQADNNSLQWYDYCGMIVFAVDFFMSIQISLSQRIPSKLNKKIKNLKKCGYKSV